MSEHVESVVSAKIALYALYKYSSFAFLYWKWNCGLPFLDPHAFAVRPLDIARRPPYWIRPTFYLYTVSQKTVQNCFCQNFVKFPPIFIIFGRKMAKRLILCEVHSFSTSPNSRHHTTVLNVDVPYCHTTL